MSPACGEQGAATHAILLWVDSKELEPPFRDLPVGLDNIYVCYSVSGPVLCGQESSRCCWSSIGKLLVEWRGAERAPTSSLWDENHAHFQSVGCKHIHFKICGLQHFAVSQMHIISHQHVILMQGAVGTRAITKHSQVSI